MTDHAVATRADWLVARKALLEREKALTRARDALRAERQALPWVRIEKDYVFEGPQGKLALGDLFEGRSQLIVQHFMFAPDWTEGCPGCSLTADHVDGARRHLEPRGVSFAAVSRAPWSRIAPFKARMGWGFRWVSSFGSDFNFDFGVSFTPQEMASGEATYNYAPCVPDGEDYGGTSAFFRDADGTVFHTYSTYARGDEAMMGVYAYLDIAPLGRNENGPRGDLGDWVRHHDRYDQTAAVHACCGAATNGKDKG